MGPLRADAGARVALLGERDRRRRVLGAHPPRPRLPREFHAPGLLLRPRHSARRARRRRARSPADDDGVRRRRARAAPPAGGRGLLPEVDRDLRGLGAGTGGAGARPRLELGELDFVEGVSRELPIRMLAASWGTRGGRRRTRGMGRRADLERRPRVLDGGHRPGGHRGVPPAALPEPGGRAVFDYASHIRKERLRRPADDVLSGMLAEDAGGRPLTELEFQNFFLLLIVAGNETTRHTISLGLLGLLDHPAAFAELAAARTGRGLFESATEEILRWTSVTMHFRRTPHPGPRPRRRLAAPGRQGRPLVHRREPRPGGVPGARAVRHPPEPEPAPRLRRRPARLPRGLARAARGPGHLRGTLPPGARR